MNPNPQNTLQTIATTVQILAVVVGVWLSVANFSAALSKEAEARKIEAAAPFFKLRQQLYREATKVAAILSDPKTHTPQELESAKKRFRELYIAELSMVESKKVEGSMKAFAEAVDPELKTFTPEQTAAYNLAHGLRDSFIGLFDLPAE
jgi:hypothetical protein